jgi:hypothetical protein
MNNYLFFHVEADGSEVQIKVEPIYGSTNSKADLQISTADYVPTKGDKLYFLPGVNIPRVKLKDLTIEYGIKSVRNIDDATHIFAGNATVHKMCTNQWMYKMRTDLFKQVYETVKDKMDDYYTENVDAALEFYTEKYIFMDYSSSNEIRNEGVFFEARNIDGVLKCLQNSKTFYAVQDEYRKYFPNILNTEVLNDATLLKYINGPDAVVIDSVMFEQLSDMFKSSDNDNHVLAMEIMSNSNYIDSLLYLELLFKEHSSKIYNSHTKKHVNFKSLLGYLGKDSMDTYVDDVMKSLIDKGVLDTDKIDIIMQRYSDEIEQRGGTDFFKVKTITVNQETLELLNKNYTYNKLENFVPEGVVEEESIEIHGDLDDLISVSGVAGVADTEVTLCEEVELTDEDIEIALTRIERNELKSELIALEESDPVSESELNEMPGAQENESNNNQIEETNGGDDFEWF